MDKPRVWLLTIPKLNKSTQLAILVGLAAIIRIAYWWITPERNASDSGTFLNAARGVLSGDISALSEYPLHATYSLLLVPGVLIPQALNWYVPLLHITLSALSVGLLYLISQQLTSDPYVHLLTALTGIFYPMLLLWLPFILTETTFIFFLLLFVYLLMKVLHHFQFKSLFLLVGVGILLFFTRPVSVTGLSAVILILLVFWARDHYPMQWVSLVSGVMIGAGICVVLLLAIPKVQQKLITTPSVAQSLWLSTRVVSGNADEFRQYGDSPMQIRAWEPEAIWEYKVDYALTFIKSHPLKYVGMGIQRFIYYYYPWLYPQWSIRHRLFDAFLSLGLTFAVIIGFRAPANNKNRIVLLGLAFAFGLTTAFSQIDTDARYRLPAEVVLIPVACLGLVYLAKSLKPKWVGSGRYGGIT